ncbi:MAG: ribose 5-phosphate isomerase B [Candidatus Omnitrophica bacterium]|nr:ribose 5-phosphate isomerase B [Candidatus Omnitrophota bacterium]
MKIAIGTDHGGFELKEKLVKFLKKESHIVKDFGTNSLESCDYPEFGIKVSRAISSRRFDRGVLICKTGVGFSIVANKFPNVRAVVANNIKVAKLSRQHNDTNVLVFGSMFVNFKKAKKILDIWLNTSFEGGRHSRRVNQIKILEKRLLKETR